MTTDAPILELSTLAAQKKEILLRWSGEPDGKLYPMIEVEDLDLDQQAELARYGDIIKTLDAKKRADDITPAEAKKLAHAISRLVRYMIPSLEDQAFDELSDGAKVKILEAFLLASPELLESVEASRGKSTRQTSASR